MLEQNDTLEIIELTSLTHLPKEGPFNILDAEPTAGKVWHYQGSDIRDGEWHIWLVKAAEKDWQQ